LRLLARIVLLGFVVFLMQAPKWLAEGTAFLATGSSDKPYTLQVRKMSGQF
jgi:hypothetical protein